MEIAGILIISGEIVYNPFNPQANLFALSNPAGQKMFSVSPVGNVYVSGDLYVVGTTDTN